MSERKVKKTYSVFALTVIKTVPAFRLARSVALRSGGRTQNSQTLGLVFAAQLSGAADEGGGTLVCVCVCKSVVRLECVSVPVEEVKGPGWLGMGQRGLLSFSYFAMAPFPPTPSSSSRPSIRPSVTRSAARRRRRWPQTGRGSPARCCCRCSGCRWVAARRCTGLPGGEVSRCFACWMDVTGTKMTSAN